MVQVKPGKTAQTTILQLVKNYSFKFWGLNKHLQWRYSELPGFAGAVRMERLRTRLSGHMCVFIEHMSLCIRSTWRLSIGPSLYTAGSTDGI